MKTEITIQNVKYVIWIDESGTAHISVANNIKEPKVLPVLRDLVVPHIKTSLGIIIDLWHTNGNHRKNTRSLAREVIEKHNNQLSKNL